MLRNYLSHLKSSNPVIKADSLQGVVHKWVRIHYAIHRMISLTLLSRSSISLAACDIFIR